MTKQIVIFGCGGHAKVITDIIQATTNHTIAAFFDNTPKNSEFLGHPVFSDLQQLATFCRTKNITQAAIAIGNNSARRKLAAEASQIGLELPVLIHPKTVISPSAKIGPGTVVMPGVIVNSDAIIESGCILNSGAVIEHDCSIGAFSHIAPGSVLCGGVTVGELTLIGARSVAIPLIRIGSQSTLGAGSVVVRDIPENVCAMGNPAKAKSRTD
ncbi:acetyltransferase [Bdellovibrio bacteriovorus]|uniref:acetyltransferase n=1 Tax=Bdellovibrio bacteriovorus TaxID=959 RepID=UPI0005A03C8E|nr:acetyltransferase [Bdellovibrio bacteriovorus]